jgi:hypothetical protein
MLKKSFKYYYSRLNSADKRVYDSVLTALEARNPNPMFTVTAGLFGGKPDIQKIVQYVDLDNQGLFYVDFSKFLIQSQSTKMSVKFNFHYNGRQIDAAERELESIITQILSIRGFAAMDAYNKELVLHDYLVKNISYGSSGAKGESTSIVGALISRQAVCEGYARAFKLLCDRAGLPAIVVSGTAITPMTKRKELHAWNIVEIDKIYSHVDVTWDSTTRGDSDTCYDHLNLTDNDAAKDHTWDKSLVPVCNSDKNNYYVRNRLCVESGFDFKNYVAGQAKQGTKTIVFRLTGKIKSMEHVMNDAQEALQRVLNGYSINLRYNEERGTGLIKWNY